MRRCVAHMVETQCDLKLFGRHTLREETTCGLGHKCGDKLACMIPSKAIGCKIVNWIGRAPVKNNAVGGRERFLDNLMYSCICVCLFVCLEDSVFIDSDLEEKITVEATDGNDLYVCMCFRQYRSLNLFLIQLNGVLTQRLYDIEVSLKGFQSKTAYPFENCS